MKTKITILLLIMFIFCILAGNVWAAESLTLKYEKEGPTFKGTIEGKGLRPTAQYILSINGKVGKDGNEILRKYGKWGGEGYYDFDGVDANERGKLFYEFEVGLPHGKYNVTFLVKDVENNYKAIYIKNYVKFTIQKGE